MKVYLLIEDEILLFFSFLQKDKNNKINLTLKIYQGIKAIKQINIRAKAQNQINKI